MLLKNRDETFSGSRFLFSLVICPFKVENNLDVRDELFGGVQRKRSFTGNFKANEELKNLGILGILGTAFKPGLLGDNDGAPLLNWQ